VRVMAGVVTLGDLASVIGVRDLEGALVAELKAGSEEAYAWLIGEFHQPIYSLVYRILTDPADAADTTQEVFLKVFRGMNHFHGQSSLCTKRRIDGAGGSGTRPKKLLWNRWITRQRRVLCGTR
jgi:Sigma-70 region 2